jgi:hypothetical protein
MGHNQMNADGGARCGTGLSGSKAHAAAAPDQVGGETAADDDHR